MYQVKYPGTFEGIQTVQYFELSYPLSRLMFRWVSGAQWYAILVGGGCTRYKESPSSILDARSKRGQIS